MREQPQGSANIDEVKSFWEKNPLFSGEVPPNLTDNEFFAKIDDLYARDIFPGPLDIRMLPDDNHQDFVLDLGCGPGCWTVQLAKYGAKRVMAADLTQAALTLAKQHCEHVGYAVETSLQNAEQMTFESEMFSHVHCSGVIHHTPNTRACVAEISRVLRPKGTAVISVYYKNIYLRCWPALKHVGRLMHKLGARLKGRGRESIYSVDRAEDLVRIFDGKENPIGKAYSKKEFLSMLEPYFQVNNIFLRYFPARSLPFKIPASLHRFLDRRTGFLIFAQCQKR